MPYIGRTLGQGTRSRFLYTATAGQTTFSGSDSQSNTLAYADNNGLDCFQNGVLLKGGGADYTATTGTSVVLTTGASVSDVIEILVYDVFAIADHVKKSGDAMTGALTNIDVNGTELILDADGDTSITADTDDQVDIKVGGTDRFSIASTGATTITTGGNESTLSLVSTDADASLGPVLDLHRNSASPADDDAIGRLVFSGENDASEKIDLVRLIGLNSDVTDGTEDGRLQLYIYKDGSTINRMDFQPTETVFNDDGANVDFRVEADSGVNCFKIDASADSGQGVVLFGQSIASSSDNGAYFSLGTDNGHLVLVNEQTSNTLALLYFNRQGSDGTYVEFRQASSAEGSITVSGSTVSYNGFSGLHESSGIATDTPVGTVVSTIDELDVYSEKQNSEKAGEEEDHPKAGQTRADHAKVKISDTAGDKAVYGVVGSFNAQGKVNVASVGIGSVRVTGACAKGDLLESNGDGTAKVQSDDIVRSKTIGKVTIGNSSTDEKLVSCVLYCG